MTGRFGARALGGAGCLLAMLATSSPARDIMVRMKTQGTGGLMVFEPAFVQAKVGDVVHFLPTDPGHNAEPIEGMLPDGVTAPVGALNKDYALTVSKPGLYGVKCKPHYSMGMVALVKAGTGPAPNAAAVAAAAVKLPPLAARRMTPMLATAK